jgi:hypothetical protein
MTTLLLRTIRLDASDAVVFLRPAEPGEWAVSGAFLFAGRDLDALSRKERIAFRSGFVGVASFGFSTLAVVSEAVPAQREEAVETLAARLVAHLGAPDLETARPAAEEEVDYAESLCAGHRPGTLIALHRTVEADGAVRERFRTLRPRRETSLGAPHLRGHERAFSVVETDDEAPSEQVDLVGLLKGRRR